MIVGNDGNNVLNGKGGIDTLTGNTGADTFVFASGETGATTGARDTVTDFTPGTDQFDLTGLDADTRTSAVDAFRFLGMAAFDGAAGALHTVYDSSRGVTVLEGDVNGDRAADFGIDLTGNKTLSSADFTAGSLLVPLTLTGTANADTLTGGALDDTLSGLGGNDTLVGNAGNDLLDGGTGADTMTGGTGNDSYVVDNAGDVVTEVSSFTVPSGWSVKGTADFDRDGQLDVAVSSATANQIWLLKNGAVSSVVDYPNATLAGWVNWSLQGIADVNGDGNKDLLYIKTTGLQDVILLSGVTQVGHEYLTGTPDPVQALPAVNAGTDTVQASISYTLSTGVENLTLVNGAGNLNGTGNGLDNVIVGNDGNNVLNGKGGIDTLTGNTGADTFVFDPSFGKMTVTDFHAGQDILQFDHTTFADVASVLFKTADDDNGNAVISVDVANFIILEQITKATLQQHLSDFHVV